MRFAQSKGNKIGLITPLAANYLHIGETPNNRPLPLLYNHI